MPALAAVDLEGIKVVELAVGSALGIALGVVVGVVPRLRAHLPLGVAAVGVGLLAVFDVANAWVVAAVLVPVGGSTWSGFASRRRPRSGATALGTATTSAVIGAGLLGMGAPNLVAVPRPVVVAVFAAVAGLAALASDRHISATAVVAMGAWTAFGLFLCNPDTEGASLVGSLLAASAVVATLPTVVGWSPRTEGGTPAGHGAPSLRGRAVPLVLLLVWVGAHGANGREDTIIGGYACLGVLLVLPLAVGVSLLVPSGDRQPGILSGRLLTAVQAPLVVVCSRIGGIRTTAERAILVSGACLALATAALTLALGHRPRPDRPTAAGSAPEPITDG